MSEVRKDSSYGQTAVSLGFATEAQLGECLEIQAKLREMGLEEPLGEILLRKRYVTPQQHHAVLQKIGVHTDPIPGYRLLGKIGRGGMGTVYKALQTSVNRTVAIKILSPAAVRDEAFVARFYREARAAGKLSHRNLIGGIDVGEAGGLYFFVMEYVTGRSCREIVAAEGPLDEPKARDVALQMAAVLDYTHGHNFVHRDIKPENILVTGDGTVKLCDLGLAKSTSSAAPSLTQEGFAVGTPHFMSPEQIHGERDVDIRADLYSLGATLYFLVTGRHPYEAKSAAEVVALHLKAPVPDPRAAVPGLGEDFARIVRKLMAKERADRHARPAELLEDLKKPASAPAPEPPRVEPPRASLTRRLRAPLHPLPRRPARAWPLGAAAAGLAAVIAGFLLFGGGPPPVEPWAAAPPPPAPRPPAAEPSRPLPDDRARIEREAMAADLAALEEETNRTCQKEDFPQALVLLDAARKRRSVPEWTAEVDRKIAGIRAAADKAYAPVKERAVEARKRGAEAEVAALVARVAKWGFQGFSEDLERSLAASLPGPAVSRVEPPATAKALEPPSPRSEPQIYQVLWEATLRLAGTRDYSAAVEVLDKTRALLKDEALRAEALAEQDVVRQIESFHAQALPLLAKWPKGQKLALEFLDEEGMARKVEEPVVRADALRIELKREGGNLVVDFGEVLAGSLAEVVRTRLPKRSPKEVRAAALFCLVEGDPEAAQRQGGEPVAEKYWILARKLADERSRPDPRLSRRDGEARRLFYAAEREFGEPAFAAAAVGRFGALLKAYADTPFVRRNRASILNRQEGGKEYFLFPGDLRGTGTFRLARTPKGDPCWTSDADTDAARRLENGIEVAFSALPETEYRCWVYAGGCCMETLAFHFQAADAPDPRAAPLQPARQTFVTATPRHASHGGPKQPTRWGWVQIPLPKFAVPGPRRVRLFTDQKGFSVAAALVSSLRTAPPKEAELQKARSDAGPIARPAPAADPSLIAHWKFDEGTGASAEDASRHGNAGALAAGASWAPGKLGGALSLDGAGGHVLVQDSPGLNGPTRALTLAAWVNRRSNQDGWRVVVARQLGTGDENQYVLAFLENDVAFVVNTAAKEMTLMGPPAPNGEWIHLAGTYDGSAVRIYVNGAESNTAPLAGPLAPDRRPLAIGGDPDGGGVDENFAGLIDDVRIYSRALSPAEVASLASPRPR